MTDTIETINEIEITFEESIDNAYNDCVLLADLPNEIIGQFIKDIAGKTVIATLDEDEDGKTIKETFPVIASQHPLNAIEAYLLKGMQRMHNDAHGGLDKFDSTESKMDAVLAMLDDFRNGIVKKARSAAIAITDVAKLARQKARVAVKIMYTESKEHDYKRDFLDGLTTSEQNDYLDSVIADDEQYTMAAQLEIDNRDKAKKTISLLALPKA